MHLTLLIPELLWPEPEPADTLVDLDCPALETLLARGQRRLRPRQAPEALLAALFGRPESAPFGALRLLGENANPSADPSADSSADPGTDCWVCADPVYLHFHQERLILADGASLGIAMADAKALAAELNKYFGDLGEFRVAAPDRWYLRLSTPCAFDVPPLSAIAGRRVDRQLPQVAHTAWLRRLLNEAQMLLHSHPANEARQAAGQRPINSLWLWGPGAAPEAAPCPNAPFDGVWSNQPLARGLARSAGVPAHPAPAGLAPLLAYEGRQLVVLDDLLGPVQYEDGQAWRDALAALERDWFAPLLQAVKSGRIEPLTLMASTVYGALDWHCTRLDAWKLWRRPPALATLIRQLADEDKERNKENA